jgi:Ca-activated chloride channel family protein
MMNFAQPHFAELRWLWLAVLGPLVLLALQYYAARARRRQLAQLAAPDFVAGLTRSHSPIRRGLKNILLVLAVAGIGLALARPQWGVREITSQNLSEDIVFAIDCSRSMLAADVAPNRLQRAKLAVQDFVRRHTNGRVGLVAFAGQAFLQCPLTFDHGAFEDALLAIDDKTIVVPGTDVGRALDESFRAMEKMDRKKVIVLITDGEDLEKSGLKIATTLAATNVIVFTVGVGTEAGAEIRVINEQGQPELVRDTKGEVVRSRLDETTLRAIAEVTKGSYEPLGALGEGLAKVRLAITSRDLFSGAAPTQRFGVDRFHVPVALVLVLLVVESLLGTRRKRPTAGQHLAGIVLLVFISLPANGATNGTNPANATNAVLQTNTITAKAEAEPEPTNAREFFNAGTRRLSEGKLREAESFLQSSLRLQESKVQAPTLYNLGHVRYAQGAEELKRSPADEPTARKVQGALAHGDQALQQAGSALDGNDVQAMVLAYLNGRGARKDLREAIDLVRRAMEAHGAALQKWQRALGDFKSALELNPNDADAKRNVAIVEEAIAKLIDKLRQMAQLAQLMGQQRQELGELMKQLRGKIPAPDAPPGEGGEEEDEDDVENPKGPREGQQEGRGRDGEERSLSREEAGWILDSFKLGGDRRLPMGQGPETKPKDKKGKNW